jgi:hypothetical protein
MGTRKKADDLSINKAISKVQLYLSFLPPIMCFLKTDHYLVVTKRKERLSLSNRIMKELHVEGLN